MRTRSGLLAIICILLGVSACGASGPAPQDGASPQAREDGIERQFIGTGFFVDGQGHVLTAAHTVANCVSLYTSKDGRTQRAELVAQSSAHDLALIKVARTQGLPAVFARTPRAAVNDLVFASGYSGLQSLVAQGGALVNAVVVGTNGRDPKGGIELVSDATYGASGAPVLSSSGLVIGVITRKLGRGRVLAVNADQAKPFLTESDISFNEDDRPQLGALQSRAGRAATVSVNVTCFAR